MAQTIAKTPVADCRWT